MPYGSPGAAHRTLRILVVEDDDAAARLLDGVLRELGHEVALAHDGPIALMVARSFRPELVLLDIGLPILDGWDLAARLRELDLPALRFMALTGHGSDEHRRRSAAAGFDHHLVKPLDLQELVLALAAL